MSYHHLSTFERGYIEALNNLGLSCRQIGTWLGRHHSNIARELNRFSNGTDYKANIAQAYYTAKRINSRPHDKWNKTLAQIVANRLIATWLPEQIANTVTLGN